MHHWRGKDFDFIFSEGALSDIGNIFTLIIVNKALNQHHEQC